MPTRPRVLVVEDAAAGLAMLHDTLKIADFEVGFRGADGSGDALFVALAGRLTRLRGRQFVRLNHNAAAKSLYGRTAHRLAA